MELTVALTILVSSLLFMASCTKDESAQPSSTESYTSDEKQINSQLVSRPLVFKSITIEHFAANTRTSQYRVIVFSNGGAIYEGIKNVKTMGTLKLNVSDKAINQINNLSIQLMKNSQQLKRDIASSADKVMAIPMVTTAFQSNDDSQVRLFRDYNNGKPIWLVANGILSDNEEK